MPRTILVAPAGRAVGLTTSTLGLIRAFDRQGGRVAFAKPIGTRSDDRSVALVALGSPLRPPSPIARAEVNDLLAAGDEQTLLERVVALCAQAAEGADVLVVEGMIPEDGMAYAMRVNQLMCKALDAELLLVGAPGEQAPHEVADALAIASRGFGELGEGRKVGCIVNRVPAGDDEGTWAAALRAEKLVPVAIVEARDDLAALRVKDLVAGIGARVLHAGDMHRRRFRDVRLCAMTVPNSVKVFAPDRLLITPADRDDIIMAVALAAMGGMRIAGLVLTGGVEPNERLMQLCAPAFATGLPVLSVDDGSYQTATRVDRLERQIPTDDPERVELAMNVVADRIDAAWLQSVVSARRTPRLSPPAFRQRLVEDARSAKKRIVLPEGTEPRTIAAAAIATSRRIAQCVLLGPPDEIRQAAEKQGVTLPSSIELIDPSTLAPRYLDGLVERRKARGMTKERAEIELQDSVMVGTMMMALGEADGLVSGAVHTTAHTIRPALQLISTCPGATSSRACSSCACRSRCSCSATAPSCRTRARRSSRTSRCRAPTRPPPSASRRASRCSRTRPGPRAPARTSRRCSRRRSSRRRAAPICSSTAPSSTTPPSCRTSPARRRRSRPSRARPRSSSSRTSTRATSPTRRCSGARASWRWDRCSRG